MTCPTAGDGVAATMPAGRATQRGNEADRISATDVPLSAAATRATTSHVTSQSVKKYKCERNCSVDDVR